jgi:hypothetical protein
LEPSTSLRQKRQEELRNRWTSQSRKIGLQTMTVFNASQITTCMNFNNLSKCTENESKVDLRPIKLFNINGFKQYFWTFVFAYRMFFLIPRNINHCPRRYDLWFYWKNLKCIIFPHWGKFWSVIAQLSFRFDRKR